MTRRSLRLLPATAVACLLVSACTGGPNRVPVGQDLISGAGGNVISAGGGNLIGGAGGNLASGGVSASSNNSPESASAMPTTVRLAMPSTLDPAAAAAMRLLAAPGPDLATSLRDNLAFYHEPSRRIDALLAAVAKTRAKAGQSTTFTDPADADRELTAVLEKGRLAIHDGETQLLGLTYTSAKAGKAVLRLENAGRRYFATDFDLTSGSVTASIALETPTQTLAGNWAFTAKAGAEAEAAAFTFEAATYVHRPADAARDGLVVISGAVLANGLGAYTYGGKTAASGDRFLYLSREGQWVAAGTGESTTFYLDASGEDAGASLATPAQRALMETRIPSAAHPENPSVSDPFTRDRFAFPN